MFVDISLLELGNLGQNNVNSLSWFHLKYQQRLENYEKNISYKKLRKCKIYTTIIDLTTFNCNRISFVLYLRSFVTSKGKLYLKDTTHSFIIKISNLPSVLIRLLFYSVVNGNDIYNDLLQYVITLFCIYLVLKLKQNVWLSTWRQRLNMYTRLT